MKKLLLISLSALLLSSCQILRILPTADEKCNLIVWTKVCEDMHRRQCIEDRDGGSCEVLERYQSFYDYAGPPEEEEPLEVIVEPESSITVSPAADPTVLSQEQQSATVEPEYSRRTDFDYNHFDQFVEAVLQAVRTEDLSLFAELLYDPVYIQGITGEGGSIGIVERSPQEAIDLMAWVANQEDLSTLTPVVREGDVSSFHRQPVYADHTIILPVFYGLRLGFDHMGDRYYITDIWLEAQ